MKRKLFTAFSLSLLLTAMLSFAVFGAETETELDLAGNYFSAGNTVTCDGVKSLDVFVAGQDLSIEKVTASGNIFAAGNFVSIENSQAGSDVFAAGNNVTLDVDTLGSLFAAGQNISYKKGSKASETFIAGSDIDFDGNAIIANIAGQKVYFDGHVTGDVNIDADEVVIGDHAVVEGELNVKSRLLDMSDNADVNELSWEESNNDEVEKVAKVSFWAKAVKKITSRFYWIPAMLIVTLILCWLFGKSLDDAKECIKKNSGEMVLCGVLSWCLIPVICLILAVTVIGLPLAAMLCAVYVVILCLGLTFAGASLGRLCFPKLHPILASVIGVAIIECVKIIPIIGTIVGIAADMYLLGYITRYIFFKVSKKNVATRVEVSE